MEVNSVSGECRTKPRSSCTGSSEHDGFLNGRGNLQFHIQSLQQMADRNVHRFVDDDTDRSAFVMFAEINHAAAEDRIMHRWHRYQEMIRKIHDCGSSGYRYELKQVPVQRHLSILYQCSSVSLTNSCFRGETFRQKPDCDRKCVKRLNRRRHLMAFPG